MVKLNIFYLIFHISFLNYNAFGLLNSYNKHSTNNFVNKVYKKLEYRSSRHNVGNLGHDFQEDENYEEIGLPNKMSLRMFYVPSLPVPKRQRISKELRQAVYGRLFTRRDARATHAGYTDNVDTCQLYNTNLQNVWNAISKYINPIQEAPDNMALHNIILLVEAYLEHHALLNQNHENPNIERGNYVINTADNVLTIDENMRIDSIIDSIQDIKQMLKEYNVEKMADKMLVLIDKNMKTPDMDYRKCAKSSKKKLKSNLVKEYVKYLEFSNCLESNELEAKNLQTLEKTNGFESMEFREAKMFLRQWERDSNSNCVSVARDTFLETLKPIINKYIDDYAACRLYNNNNK